MCQHMLPALSQVGAAGATVIPTLVSDSANAQRSRGACPRYGSSKWGAGISSWVCLTPDPLS